MKNFLENLSFLLIRVITLDYLVVKKEIRRVYSKGNRVLDLGSGNGFISQLFNKKYYIGVELDPDLVAWARRRYPGYNFRLGDITKTRLNKKFDMVLVVGVLHHLNNEYFENALETIRLHLKLSGRALIIEATHPISKFNIFGNIVRFLDRGDYVRSIQSYNARMKKKFSVKESKLLRGGIVDYALFVLGRQKS